LTLNPEKFNISEMLEDIVNHYSFELAKVHCEIKVESDRSLFGLLDKIRIEQVIINILTNAAKYAPGKPIDVKLTSTNNNWIKFCISDQGPGIAPDNLERIFDRFERIKDRDNVGGLGLGLYISKEIVTAHGGKIYVESELGNGSTFNIELPQKPLEESV
jgi:signal transduction histidine kinase